MNATTFDRLRALILPRLEGDTDPWAEEVRALLTPGTFYWPPEPGLHIPAIPREEVPAHLRTADAMPLGVEWHATTDRF